jgi:hypothetical protein
VPRASPEAIWESTQFAQGGKSSSTHFPHPKHRPKRHGRAHRSIWSEVMHASTCPTQGIASGDMGEHTVRLGVKLASPHSHHTKTSPQAIWEGTQVTLHCSDAYQHLPHSAHRLRRYGRGHTMLRGPSV